MRIQLVPSSVGERDSRQYAMSVLVGDSLAIDAGSIGYLSPLEVQRKIEHVFLSHTHLDHVASLPLFLDNVYQPGPDCPTLYGTADTLDSLSRNFFNERMWPDLLRVSREETPFLRLQVVESGRRIRVGAVSLTPVDLDHTVPTLGFILEDETSSVALVYDTAPTDLIWSELNARQNLKAVFLEASFPNAMEWLARKTKHLTPGMFCQELAKLRRPVPVVAIHLKPAYHDAIVRELLATGRHGLEIGQPGKTYEF